MSEQARERKRERVQPLMEQSCVQRIDGAIKIRILIVRSVNRCDIRLSGGGIISGMVLPEFANFAHGRSDDISASIRKLNFTFRSAGKEGKFTELQGGRVK